MSSSRQIRIGRPSVPSPLSPFLLLYRHHACTTKRWLSNPQSPLPLVLPLAHQPCSRPRWPPSLHQLCRPPTLAQVHSPSSEVKRATRLLTLEMEAEGWPAEVGVEGTVGTAAAAPAVGEPEAWVMQFRCTQHQVGLDAVATNIICTCFLTMSPI